MTNSQHTEDLPTIGAKVSLTVYSIGGRSERVTGTVTSHGRRGRSVIVSTVSHGNLAPELSELECAYVDPYDQPCPCGGSEDHA